MVRDRFGRPLTGLRISVNYKCNLRCVYCHHEGCLPSSLEMTPEEIGEIVEVAAEFGVRKVKLTGGEPLLRKDIMDVISAVARPGIEEISMTTNGTLLAEVSHELVEAGLTRINISLDTLNPETFAKITGSDLISDVFAGIDAALDAGLKPVKLNMVLLAGLNEEEVESMIAYASRHGAILQIIELLKGDGIGGERYYCSLDKVEKFLRSRAIDVRIRRGMQARRKYILPEGEVEVVRPMHNSEFCMHCTRLRLTPHGYLKPCLMRNDNLVDVLTPIKAGDVDGVRRAFEKAIMAREPYFRGAFNEACFHGSV